MRDTEIPEHHKNSLFVRFAILFGKCTKNVFYIAIEICLVKPLQRRPYNESDNDSSTRNMPVEFWTQFCANKCHMHS